MAKKAPSRAVDPTHTLTLRLAYEKAATGRFRRLLKLIREYLIDHDALGWHFQAHAYAFPTSGEKVRGFMAWLDDMIDREILEVQYRQGPNIVSHAEWQDIYVDSAYQRGIRDARRELGRLGIEAGDVLAGAMNQPIHAESVGMLYIRNFEELRGVTAAMAQGISRELAQGMAEGLNPKTIASRIAGSVEKIGITRARMIARTEIIRAHAEANLNVYEQMGIEGVSIRAEILTAGDDRVCDVCAGHEGETVANPIPIDEARGLIPFHPNCRCCYVPVVKTAKERHQKVEYKAREPKERPRQRSRTRTTRKTKAA